MKSKQLSILLLLLVIGAVVYFKQSPKQNALGQKEACENGDISACKILGGEEKKAGNIEAAKHYYNIACEKKDAYACHFLAEIKRLEHEKAEFGQSNGLSAPTQAEACDPSKTEACQQVE